MNDFEKIFGLAFYSSFLRKELNCDKENMIISNRCSFQMKMLSSLTCVLIYSMAKCILEHGFKDTSVLKVLKNLSTHNGIY